MEGILHSNIFSDIPDRLPDELIQELAGKGDVRIERIVSRGHVSRKWCDQEKDEFVLVLTGEAKLRYEGADRLVHLKTGDYLIIQAHERHRVEWTDPHGDTVWLAVHF